MIAPLKSKKKIDVLFEKGTIVKEKNLFIKYYDFKDENIQFGVSVSKKLFSSAVKRNLIKRRLREQINSSKLRNHFPRGISFFIIYTASEILSSKIIAYSLDNLINKIKLI